MPRTAITIGLTEDGKTVLVTGEDVPYGAQRAAILGPNPTFPKGVVRLKLYAEPEKVRDREDISKARVAAAEAKADAKRPKVMVDKPLVLPTPAADPQIANTNKVFVDGPALPLDPEARAIEVASRLAAQPKAKK